MKNEFVIKLNELMDVHNFVRDMCMFDSEIDIMRGRYVINAKSYLGLLSLDLSMPLAVKINPINEEELLEFNNVIENYSMK